MLYDHKKVEHIKEKYPSGTRIQLIFMAGEADMPSGLMGTVDFVDDIGQLQMKWDNGRSLALVPDVDNFATISKPEHKQEKKCKPHAPLIGANGNIFNLMGIASRTLREAGLQDQADQMCNKLIVSGSYEEALNIISEYVNFDEADQPENEAEQCNMKME